jgi:hypothetical protein
MPEHTRENYRGANFVAIEKNLASLGYFTPSNKRVRKQATKTVTFTKLVDGKRLQAKATIVSGATFGLPTTADQDKYIALQRIVMDSKKLRFARIWKKAYFQSPSIHSVECDIWKSLHFNGQEPA